jgi:hypothetical protein
MLEGPHELSPDIFVMSQTNHPRGIEVTPAPTRRQPGRIWIEAVRIAESAFRQPLEE